MDTNQTYNRMVLLGLFDEFDVKGKFSAKWAVWNFDGTPCDVLGVAMSRIGYANKCGRNAYHGIDPRLKDILKLSNNQISNLYCEIDRKESTNESIKALVIKCFTESAINETDHSSSP